jgi:uncharacterized RDD family membrane protein YckC
MDRSGFWIRTAALAIDAIVFLVFAGTIRVTEMILHERGSLTPAKQRGLEALIITLWLGYTSMEAMIGATTGKLLTGIVIALPDGAPAPPWTRFLRWSTKQFGFIMLLIWVATEQPLFYFIAGSVNGLLAIGCLRALGEEKRTWHDLWSHTAVVPRPVAARMREIHEEPVGPPTPT